MDCAIFSALPEELIFVEAVFAQQPCEIERFLHLECKIYAYQDRQILVAPTGLGTTFAATVLTLVQARFAPDIVLFSGTAGGIQPALQIGDAVVIEEAFEAEIQGLFEQVKGTPFAGCLLHPLHHKPFPHCYAADPELLQLAKTVAPPSLKIHYGRGVTSNAFPAPPELYARIKHEKPLCIDMETSAFYQVAWLLQMRVLAIRGISNCLQADGSDDQLQTSDIEGSSQAAAQLLLKILAAWITNNKQLQTPASLPADVERQVSAYTQQLKLQPHPEGGAYVRVFCSSDQVKSLDPNRYNDEPRYAGSSIYYLLKGHDFSAWHCLKSDEIWHAYQGSLLKIHVIDDKGKRATFILGNPSEHPLAAFQVCIPAGSYFAAEVMDKQSFSLVGCTVTPGFEFKDYELAEREALVKKFPQHRSIIHEFTRVARDGELLCNAIKI